MLLCASLSFIGQEIEKRFSNYYSFDYPHDVLSKKGNIKTYKIVYGEESDSTTYVMGFTYNKKGDVEYSYHGEPGEVIYHRYYDLYFEGLIDTLKEVWCTERDTLHCHTSYRIRNVLDSDNKLVEYIDYGSVERRKFDSLRRREYIVDKEDSTSYSYINDSIGKLIKEYRIRYSSDGIVFIDSTICIYTFDSIGKLIKIKSTRYLPDGRVYGNYETYKYDSSGRAISYESKDLIKVNKLVSAEYDENGNMTKYIPNERPYLYYWYEDNLLT